MPHCDLARPLIIWNGSQSLDFDCKPYRPSDCVLIHESHCEPRETSPKHPSVHHTLHFTRCEMPSVHAWGVDCMKALGYAHAFAGSGPHVPAVGPRMPACWACAWPACLWVHQPYGPICHPWALPAHLFTFFHVYLLHLDSVWIVFGLVGLRSSS